MTGTGHEVEERRQRSPGAAESVRMTRGFLAFIGVMLVPAFLAAGIVAGAWAVSAEVYAAEAAEVAGQETPAVEEWKRTLVGICPIH